MTKKEHWLFLIFDVTFFIGYLFRLLVFGWGMIIFGIPEYIFRSSYYLLGTFILVKNMRTNQLWQIYTLQFFYLLTSFFSYDGGDKSTYTFANLWQNPPEYIYKLWLCFVVITLSLLIIFLNWNAKLEKSDNDVKVSWFFKIVNGCFFIPFFAIFIFLIIARFFNL